MTRLTDLLGEIHRRSVWQILGSYAVGAWLVLQLADTVSSLIGLPLWFGPAVVALLVAGAPLLLLTSVVQGGRRPADSTTPIEAGGALRRVFTWRNAAVGTAVVLIVFGAATGGYLGLRQMGVGPVGTLQAKGVIDREERLILAEFDNRSSDPTLAETVTALLRIDLAQSSAITILQPGQVAPVLARMERDPTTRLTFDVALEAARREGLKAVIAGEVLPLGSGFVISTRLVSVASGDILVAERETAPDIADVPSAVDRLSAQLRERIGESLRTIQGDPPLRDVTTRSLQALEKYAQAERANDEGDVERAISLLEEALAEDPGFAMAHRKLAVVLSNLGRDPERVRQEATAAFEGRQRLTERERYLAEAAYHSYVAPDRAATIRAYESLLDRYPTDPVALNNLALAMEQLGRIEEADRLYRRSIAAGGAPAVTYDNAIRTQVRLGMPDSAEATWRSLAAAHPNNPDVMRIRSALESAAFRFDAAEEWAQRLLDTTRGSPTWQVRGELYLANLALTGGRVEEARTRFRRIVDLDQKAGLSIVPEPVGHFEAQIEATILLLFHDDTTGAVATLDRALAAAPAESPPAESRYPTGLAVIYAVAGRPEAARALLDQAVSPSGGSATPRAGTEGRPEALGWVAIAEGRYAEAAATFLAWQDSVPECGICGWFERGLAFRAMNLADSAVANFQRYLERDVLERVEADSFKLWLTYLELAHLYEALGEPRRAADYYERFVDLWSDADPQLQPKVVEARMAIERLRGRAR